MRYLILSDIHSNLEALEECLKLADGKYDQVLCLGDLVGYGPDPNAVIRRVRDLGAVVIRGNHDKACSGLMDTEDFNALARAATDWTRAQLSQEETDFLRNLPQGPLSMDGFQLVHGSPGDEDEYILSTVEAISALQQMMKPITFFGHTHYQGGFSITAAHSLQSITHGPSEDQVSNPVGIFSSCRYLVNPGSVGQPRDGDWRAAFIIFDQEKKLLTYYRTGYNIEKTQEKMRAADLPEPLVRRLEIGR